MILFLDTSGFKAYHDKEDRHHKAARELVSQIASRKLPVTRLITSDYFVDECATLIKVTSGAEEACRFLEAVQKSTLIEKVGVEETVFEAANKLFTKAVDRRWSFTDCTSFALMKKLKVKGNFCFDHHLRSPDVQLH